jgi:RNA polymerase sigma factor (sigma-70 family)
MHILEEHYRTNKAKLVKRLSFRAGTTWAAEDVVQEAYLRAWKYFGSLSDPKEFPKWFSTILNNCLVDYKNLERGQIPEYEEEDPAFLRYPEMIVRDVFKMIAARPKAAQEILTLYFKQEYTAVDISRITEYSYAQVHKTIQLFRNELKEIYRE